ncbi:MAG: (2Fe-2S)-binding protein [Actinomycetota bacterium]|nr:(2Fe-2S)-binding protein [Actinomycetota bacterium]
MEPEIYRLTVNGEPREVQDAWLGESLLYVLRERLGLPGSKGACEQGECGSCTVLLDGAAVCACLVMAASATDADIVTVEGLTAETTLTDVQAAFLDEGAVQCGFCTPGLIVAVHHLLEHNPEPTALETREALSGNICRCTGYGRIFAAVDAVVASRAEQSPR